MGSRRKPASARPSNEFGGYGSREADDLLNTIRARPVFGHERRGKTAHPADNSCRFAACEVRAAITHTSVYLNRKGEEAERREQLCLEHFRLRKDEEAAWRNGTTPPPKQRSARGKSQVQVSQFSDDELNALAARIRERAGS